MDKDIALVIAEMLIKQDEATEQIKKLNSVVKNVVAGIDVVANNINTVVSHIDTVTSNVNTIASNVHTVSINIETTNNILTSFADTSAKQWEQQQKFNEIFANELKEIKVAVKTFAQIEDRIKTLEERENNLEIRLSNIERLLKAS